MKKIVATKSAPGAVGPYSQAVRAGDFLFVSGQLGIDPATSAFVAGGVAEQTERALANVRAILEEAGAGLEAVVKTTVYLQSIGDFAAMNEVYKTFFTGDYPARAAFEVARLPLDGLVEIEAIAYLGGA